LALLQPARDAYLPDPHRVYPGHRGQFVFR